uniref:Uncharacterized protein n=1 Tax=Gouania willdenowi TaxID=441366 RepID=A0A8C5DG69_GOUWI
MSTACNGMSEHHFLCSICLEVLNDPVTTPCGHNFCKTCISTCWDTSTTSKCPVCNQVFSTKPQLKVNIMMRELVSQFRLESESHQFVPLGEDLFEDKKVYLQQMIQKRREKLKEIKESVRIRKDAADREIAEGVEMFTALMKLVQRGLNELIEKMEEQQEAEEREADSLIKELEEEISELMKRSSEVMVRPSSYEGTVLRAVTQLEDTLSDKMMKMKMLAMKRLQQFAVDVTLDPLTAHPNLVLSDDGKQVCYSDVWKNLPDNKERFSPSVNVSGKQSFGSGRFYFEVQVKRKTKWYLGVVKESINRKGYAPLTPKNGYWTLILRDGKLYKGCEDPSDILHLKCVPEKVGVFVDYEGGVVSFYDVDAAALIDSFTHCCFTHKLQPFFSPCLNYGGKNSAPLIICPVNQR